MPLRGTPTDERGLGRRPSPWGHDFHSLCLGLPDVTPCGIRFGFSISHYIWHPSSGWRRRLVIYEPRDQPDVGTAAGHPSALRLALQVERHQSHCRQCLHGPPRRQIQPRLFQPPAQQPLHQQRQGRYKNMSLDSRLDLMIDRPQRHHVLELAKPALHLGQLLVQRPVAEPSRNRPCPCGSGRKYKQCHGSPTAARP